MFRTMLVLRKLLASFISVQKSKTPSLIGLVHEPSQVRRPRPTVKLELEGLTERILPSASSLVLPAAADATPQMTASLGQWMNLMAIVERDLSNAWNLIAQESIRYAQQQWEHLLGITSNAPNQSFGTTAAQAGSGTTTQKAAASAPSIPKTIAQASVTPQVLAGGYLWDPTQGTNASNAENWDYMGKSQVGNPNAMKPGDTPDQVVFDPAETNTIHGNGASPITWDYNATFPSMHLGPQSAYTSVQTINSGITVDTAAG